MDMSTPLLLEVAPEIDTNPTSFHRGRDGVSVRLQTPVIGSRSALAMSVHPTYFDLATPLHLPIHTSTIQQMFAHITYGRESVLLSSSTLGDRAFPAAAARAWNSLPTHVRNAPTLVAFRQELKTVLFRECFPVD